MVVVVVVVVVVVIAVVVVVVIPKTTTNLFSLDPRFFNLTTTAIMVGGTQLFEEAHLTGGNTRFCRNQADVAITFFSCPQTAL